MKYRKSVLHRNAEEFLTYLPDPYPTRRGVTPVLRSSYLFPPLEPILHPEAKRLRRIEAADYGRKTLDAPTAIPLCVDKKVMFSRKGMVAPWGG